MGSDLVFLLSSKVRNPDRLFQGYFFHDTDYVFGEAGFEEFLQKKGLDSVVREDGCYVLAEKNGQGYRFSADYSGYKKLFYFWDSGFWVVSNSLYRIATHLLQHGYAVVPNIPQLAGMATEGTFYPSGRGSFFSQLTSFETIIRGVRLVPADCALWIGSSGPRMEKTVYRPEGDYRDQLGRFISTWVGRLRTLLKEPSLQIACDLTGGLDSRSVFALLLNAARDSQVVPGDRLQIRSWGAGKDRSVAARLCKHSGFSLNGPLAKSPTWLQGRTAYAIWQDLCLGIYHPISFPGAAQSGDMVSLGGGGGENHRPFYSQFVGAPAPDAFVAKRSRNVVFPSARRDFEVALRQAVDTIMDGAPANLDAMASHYRHFRNRFHAGRESQYSVTFLPLASKLLDRITAAGGEARFRNAQLHYDTLYNTEPELLNIPFDSWRKRPGRVVRKSFLPIAERTCSSGTCFTGGSRAPPRERGKSADAIDYLREDFSAAKAPFAVDFLGPAYVRRAERALKTATRTGAFSGPIQSKRVAVVIACAMFETRLRRRDG